MSGERPDVLDRLDAAAIAVATLNALLVADGSLDDVLHGVALNAVRAVPGADAVSITLVDPPLRTVAHTDDDILVLDQEQYARRKGLVWRPQRPVGQCGLRWGPASGGGRNSSRLPARPVCAPLCRFP
jgi:hypothetical protein